MRNDAGIIRDHRMQLAVPGIDANDLGRAACKKNMGKASGRGTDIETNSAKGIEAEGIESSRKLDTAARDPRVGRPGLNLGTHPNRRGRFADDFAVNPYESGGDSFLRLGAARKEL